MGRCYFRSGWIQFQIMLEILAPLSRSVFAVLSFASASVSGKAFPCRGSHNHRLAGFCLPGWATQSDYFFPSGSSKYPKAGSDWPDWVLCPSLNGPLWLWLPTPSASIHFWGLRVELQGLSQGQWFPKESLECSSWRKGELILGIYQNWYALYHLWYCDL